MRILVADDQRLVVKAIENHLSDTQYETITASDGLEAIELFESMNPDLLILDINMPTKSGFDVIHHVRHELQSKTPIIVMTSADDEITLAKAFTLGADDFIEKPVGINKLLLRIQKLLKQPINSTHHSIVKSQTIDKHMVGVVIPCYNEELRIKKSEFFSFIDKNPSYHLCFVNDGSTDSTLAVLQQLVDECPDNISVYDCAQNGGKAEAVRQGMLHLSKDLEYNYIGFLDADLSTDLADFDGLVKTLSDPQSSFEMVNGSRIARMGANIHKDGARQLISKTINLIIRKILGMPFQDTQCGAKVMTPEIAKIVFKQQFLTRWLFDVEIFMRMKKRFGSEAAIAMLCEKPLKRWVHEDGSKLSMKDSIKILGQLMQIAVSYR